MPGKLASPLHKETAVTADHSPTVRRRRLGIELRRLREAADYTIEDVAKHLECSGSKVSRIETGKGMLRIRDVRDMLDLYGATDEAQRDPLLTMAREGQQKGWWTEYEPSAGLEIYIGLEAEAAAIRHYHTHVVAGLLQTEDYARALLRAVRVSDPPEEIERLVALRMRRQSILYRAPQPLDLWAVVDEAVLRRPIGGKAVMQQQLLHLIELCELPNVTLQVLPFARGAHAGLDGSFVIIGFPDPTDADVVSVESPAGNIYLEKAEDLRRYTTRFDHLRAAALPTDESIRSIQDVAKELT
jgi:transcriptional regulator with XRE-family HTH domain